MENSTNYSQCDYQEEVKSHFSCNGVPGAQLEAETSLVGKEALYLEKLFFGVRLL